QIVKERFANNRLAVELACLSEEGVFYAFPGDCQPLFSVTESSERGEPHNCSNLLTNRRFSPSFTAGNAWRPRQRMRTLRIRCRLGKGYFENAR
ncbi:MAG: hypothetical protein Q8S08_15760, partial [Halomonas sp.]